MKDVENLVLGDSELHLQHRRSSDAWRLGTAVHLEELDVLADGGWAPCSHDGEIRGTGQLRSPSLDGLSGRDPWWVLSGENLGGDVTLRLNGTDDLGYDVVGPLWAACWRSGFGVVTVDQPGYDRRWAYLDEHGLRGLAYSPSLERAVAARCLGRSLRAAREAAALEGFEVEVRAHGWIGGPHVNGRITVTLGSGDRIFAAEPG